MNLPHIIAHKEKKHIGNCLEKNKSRIIRINRLLNLQVQSCSKIEKTFELDFRGVTAISVQNDCLYYYNNSSNILFVHCNLMSTDKTNDMCISLIMSVLRVEIAIIESNQSDDLIKNLEVLLMKMLPSKMTIGKAKEHIDFFCDATLPGEFTLWSIKPLLFVKKEEKYVGEEEERENIKKEKKKNTHGKYF